VLYYSLAAALDSDGQPKHFCLR